ncbi:MAG: DUF1353 domain-containing protein [Verrucomicrobiota bacterium]|nr:DUF1353 domain-containing protein [Verrucomicrobiota bacterium]
MRARWLLPLLLLASCAGPLPSPVPSGQPSGWGKFTGPFNVELLDDGRRLRLLNEVSYTDPAGVEWRTPAGWVVDGASIPKQFWTAIGGPLEGRYRNASIFHDYVCDKRDRSWEAAARMFYNAMRCGGVEERKAKLMYAAVYLYGPHWTVGGRTETRPRLQARRSPTAADVRRLRQFVARENPSLDQIETRAKVGTSDAPNHE